MKHVRLCIIAAIFMGCIGQVHAEVLAYETFQFEDYAVGQSLVGTDVPGVGFKDDWKYVNGTSGNEEILAESLVVPAQVPSMNADTSGALRVKPDDRVGCFLDTSPTGPFAELLDTDGTIGKPGTSIYMSFQMKPDTAALFWAFEIKKGGLGDDQAVLYVGNDIGSPSGKLQLCAYRNRNQDASNMGKQLQFAGDVSLEPELLVMRIDFQGGNGDDVYLWRNPSSETEPSVEDASAALTDPGSLKFDGISFGVFVGPACTFDEVCIGETFEDVMSPYGRAQMAKSPKPRSDSTDVIRDSLLSWTSGDFAATHQVYVGESFEDVNSAAVPTATLDVNSFDPGRFEFDKTYYWRVDEVNGTPDKTIFKGKVWSFTVEPYSIMIPGSSIVVTASSFSNEFSTPEKTIDGSGLGANGMHGIGGDTMWFTTSNDLNPWIQYEFDEIKKLDIMKVWNSNSAAEMAIGWGVKGVEIQTSMDGETWHVLEGVSQFNRASGSSRYNQYDEIDFGGVAARYVRLNIQSNWGGILKSYGLSEVQFSMIPVVARMPVPASDSINVHPCTTIKWRAGRDVGQHTLYVSTDMNAVAEGLAPSVTMTTNSLNLSSLDLQLGETYYWRVNEVNDTEIPSVWTGPVWSFRTAASLIVDDFESYTNKSPHRIFQTWLDGYGYSADAFFPVAYGGNGTGAGVGHDNWTPSSPYFGLDFMETVITLPGSGQSMPFYYNNVGSVASQIERQFTVSQDWTIGAAKTLSIAFHGQTGNTGTLYAKINDVKVTYSHDPGDIAGSVWQVWNIDLASVTTNLKNVTKLQIGIDGSGVAGMILIDDIKLYPLTGELITPVDPGTDGLVASLTFEGNLNDSSGHGHNGTVVGTGGTQIVSDPVRGQVLSLPGGEDQYVEIGAVGISGTMPRTIACWAKAANTTIPDWTLIFGFTGTETGEGVNGSHFNIGSLGGPGGVGAHCWGWEERMVSDEEALIWHHYAMTYDGTTIAYFLDGVQMDSDSGKSNVQDLSLSGDRVFIGSRVTQTSSFPGNVDNAVVYNRVLTANEIFFLADRATPIDKPF